MSAEGMVEYENARESALSSIKKLVILDEDNELLRFCHFVISRRDALCSRREDGWFADKESFHAKFLTDEDREKWPEGDVERCVRATENYARDLQEKLDEIEGSM